MSVLMELRAACHDTGLRWVEYQILETTDNIILIWIAVMQIKVVYIRAKWCNKNSLSKRMHINS